MNERASTATRPQPEVREDPTASGLEGRRLLANITWLGLASACAKPFWFVFITFFCAHMLGAEGYGRLNTALALASIAFSLTGLGLRQYTVREVAATPSLASRFYTNFVSLHLLLSLAAAALALCVGAILGYDHALLVATLFACLYQLSLSLLEYNRGFFESFGVLGQQAVSVVVEKALVLLAGSAALLAFAKAEWTLLGMATGAAVTSAGVSVWVGRRLAPFRVELWDAEFLRQSVRPLLPFAVAGVLGMLFFRVDNVMVEAIEGVAAAGQYGLAFRIVEALNMLPLIVAHSAVYPKLSALASQRNEADYRRLVRLTGVTLGVLSMGIAAVVFFSAPLLIGWIANDPQLREAEPVLRLLCWAFPLTAIRTLLYVSLLARGEQRFIALALFVAVALNVSLNALLIPTLGVVGAALTTIASEVLLLGSYLACYHQSRSE